MKNFEAARECFKDSIDISFYFDSLSAEIARKKVLEALGDDAVPLIFVLGDPGVGKSHMMRVAYSQSKLTHPCIFLERPFFDPKDLLKVLFEFKSVPMYVSLYQGEMIEKLVSLYEGDFCTIFIDESHLLNAMQFEFIRILSDTKQFQFVLALPKDEGSKLLEKKQFYTRQKLVIEYGDLEENELLRYIQTVLKMNNLDDVSAMFSRSEAKTIARYAKGNFRLIKKFLYTLMKLLHYAQKHQLSKYRKINSSLLTMAALDIGLIRD